MRPGLPATYLSPRFFASIQSIPSYGFRIQGIQGCKGFKGLGAKIFCMIQGVRAVGFRRGRLRVQGLGHVAWGIEIQDFYLLRSLKTLHGSLSLHIIVYK